MQDYFTEIAKMHLDSTEMINLSAAGKLEKIQFQVGDKVRKGEVLARLQQLPLHLAVNKAQQSYLGMLKYKNSAEEEIKVIDSMRQLSAATLIRNEKLLKKGYSSKQYLDNLAADYTSKTAQWREQLQKVKALSAGLLSIRSDLRSAKYNLANSTMRSPINGVILQRYTEGGLWLSAGKAIMQIGNPKQIEAVPSVLSFDAQKLKVGDFVQMGVDGYQYPYQCVVKQIYPQAFTKLSALGVEEQRVKVIIAFKPGRHLQLVVNYRLYEKFITANLPHAMIVPRESFLQDGNGSYVVHVLGNSKSTSRKIKVGLINDRYVQVLSGLKPDDEIKKVLSL